MVAVHLLRHFWRVEIYWEVAESVRHIAKKDWEKQGNILSCVAKNSEALVEQKCVCCMQILMKLVI